MVVNGDIPTYRRVTLSPADTHEKVDKNNGTYMRITLSPGGMHEKVELLDAPCRMLNLYATAKWIVYLQELYGDKLKVEWY